MLTKPRKPGKVVIVILLLLAIAVSSTTSPDDDEDPFQSLGDSLFTREKQDTKSANRTSKTPLRDAINSKRALNVSTAPLPRFTKMKSRLNSGISSVKTQMEALEKLKMLQRELKGNFFEDVIEHGRRRNLFQPKVDVANFQVFNHNCAWKDTSLRLPLQGIVRTLRTVNRFFTVDARVDQCIPTKWLFGNKPKNQVPLPRCSVDADCPRSINQLFCNENGDCVDCVDENDQDVCDDNGVAEVKPVNGGQCFNVCVAGGLSREASCASGVTQLIMFALQILSRQMCGGPERTGSIADSVFTGRFVQNQYTLSNKKWQRKLAKALRFLFPKALTISAFLMTGLPTVMWTRTVSAALYAISLLLKLLRLAFQLLGSFCTYCGKIAKALKKLEKLFSAPYKRVKKADDEIEVKCVVPCNGKSGLPGDAASNAQYSYFPGVFEKLSDVDKANLIKKGFVASPWKKPYESISSKRDTRAMCHNQNNKKTFNTNLKKRSGVIQRISQVAQRITNFFYDLRVFSQLYYTFLAVPIESFLCEESNRYGQLNNVLDESCVQQFLTDPDNLPEFCKSPNRRLTGDERERDLAVFEPGLKDIYVGNIFKTNDVVQTVQQFSDTYIKNPVDAINGAFGSILSAIAPLGANGEEILNYLFSVLTSMELMNSLLEKISTVLITPFSPLVTMMEVFRKLLSEFGLDLEDLNFQFESPLDWLFDAAFKPVLEAFFPNCDELTECLLQIFLFEPFGIDCNCFGPDDCEEERLEYDGPPDEFVEKDCIVALLGKLDIDLNLLDGWLLEFELPGLNISQIEFVFDTFGIEFASLFNLQFFDLDYDPFGSLVDALQLNDIFQISVHNFRAFSNGTDDVKINFECENDGWYPIVQSLKFTMGKRCNQDLSARFRYPCLDENGDYISSCERDFQNFLVGSCTDEIEPLFEIDAPYEFATLDWLPADNFFRRSFEMGVIEAQYLCWGLAFEPPFLGELLSTPEQASPANSRNGRFTTNFTDISNPSSTEDNQIFISTSNDRFSPSKRPPLCESINQDIIEGIPSTTDKDFVGYNCESEVVLKYGVSSIVGDYFYIRTLDFARTTVCRDDVICTDSWLSGADSWPGSATSFPGSSLEDVYAYVYPRQRADDNYEKTEGSSLSVCRTGSISPGGNIFEGLGDVLFPGWSGPVCDSAPADVLYHTPGESERLGSVENVLMRRQYKSPQQAGQEKVVCPSGREIFVEHFEYEPCIDQSTYGQGMSVYDQGYCAFRDSLGDLDTSVRSIDRLESMCTGQRACNSKCQATNPRFFGCNCRDNNCVTSNGNYLHLVWRNLPGGSDVDSFDKFLQEKVDKGRAYVNWGSCTYWINGGDPNSSSRKHSSSSVETGSNPDTPRTGFRFATLFDCIVGTGSREKCERVFEPLSSTCGINGRTESPYSSAVSDYNTRLSTLGAQCTNNILSSCHGSRTCDISECTEYLGLFQHACLRPAGLKGFGQLGAAFYDSKRADIAQIICPQGSIDIDGVALYGKPFVQQEVTSTFFSSGKSPSLPLQLSHNTITADFCGVTTDDDPIVFCNLDIKLLSNLQQDTEVNAKGKTLRVDYTCFCGDNFYPLPDPVQNVCVPCPSGYARSASVDPSCVECPRGTYQVDGVGCLETPVGTYVEGEGATSFKVCPESTYTLMAGSTSIDDCLEPPEHFIASAEDIMYVTSSSNRRRLLEMATVTVYTSIVPCPAGSERLLDETGCQPCLLGSVRAANSTVGCAPCPAGTQSNSALDDCIPCPPGTYSGSGSETCISCVTGCFAAGEENIMCSRCPFGKTTIGLGQSSCDAKAPAVAGNIAFEEDTTCAEHIASKAADYPHLLVARADVNLFENITAEDSAQRNVGNGICDIPLNTPNCDYDGGDCCEATCVKQHDIVYPTMISFFEDLVDTNYFPAFENPNSTGVTDESITFLIDGLLGSAGTVIEEDDGTTEAVEAFLEVAKRTMEVYEADIPPIDDSFEDSRMEAFITFEQSRNQSAEVFPFGVDEEVFKMTDLNGDGEVEVAELMMLFWDIFEVYAAEAESRASDVTCRSFLCLDPEILFSNVGCEDGLQVLLTTEPDNDPNACDGLSDVENDAEWGNGICDDKFNHESCNYDGGDCCITTCVKNPCLTTSCLFDSFTCRDPSSVEDKQPPRFSILQENIQDVVVESNNVPKPFLVRATDNVPCAPPNVTYTEVRVDGACPASYTLFRTWNASDESGNIAEPLQHVITVVDSTSPLDLYSNTTVDGSGAQLPVLCVLDDNWDWIAIPNATTPIVGTFNGENPNPPTANNIDTDRYGLEAMLVDAFEDSVLRWNFFDSSAATVNITNCTNSVCGSTDGCVYDEDSDTLYLQGVRGIFQDNIYTIEAEVEDDCGNSAKMERRVVVASRQGKFFRETYGDLCDKGSSRLWETTLSGKQAIGSDPKNVECFKNPANGFTKPSASPVVGTPLVSKTETPHLPSGGEGDSSGDNTISRITWEAIEAVTGVLGVVVAVFTRIFAIPGA